FFRRHYASCNDDRPPAGLLRFFLKPCCNRCVAGDLQIVFQIAADSYPVRWSAQCLYSLRVLLGLHRECAEVAQLVPEKRLQKKSEKSEVSLVPPVGPVGDSPADENHRNPASRAFAQKIRPDFR